MVLPGGAGFRGTIAIFFLVPFLRTDVWGQLSTNASGVELH